MRVYAFMYKNICVHIMSVGLPEALRINVGMLQQITNPLTTCIYTYMYIYTYTYMYIYKCICIYICTYICACICIYIKECMCAYYVIWSSSGTSNDRRCTTSNNEPPWHLHICGHIYICIYMYVVFSRPNFRSASHPNWINVGVLHQITTPPVICVYTHNCFYIYIYTNEHICTYTYICINKCACKYIQMTKMFVHSM